MTVDTPLPQTGQILALLHLLAGGPVSDDDKPRIAADLQTIKSSIDDFAAKLTADGQPPHPQEINELPHATKILDADAFRSSPAALSITRLSDGKYLAVNDSLCQMLGYSPEEITGRTTVEMGIYKNEEERQQFLRLLREKGGSRYEERTIRDRSGRQVSAILSLEPIEISGEACLLTTMIDITERKWAEEALRKEARFRGAYNHAAIGFAMSTHDGLFVDANLAYCALTGYSLDELRTFAFKELLHPEDAAENMQLYRQMRTGQIEDFVIENRYVRKDGQAVWVRKSISQTDRSEDSPGLNIVLVEDITERKLAEEALRAANEALNERNLALERAHNDLVNERNRLLAVMDALPIGLAMYDMNGGVIQANQGFEAVWGSPRPPANSVDDYELYKAWWVETGQRVQPEEWAAACAVLKGETVTGQYIQIQKFDGTTGFILNSGAPVRDAQGQITGGAVAIMDITGRIQAEKSLRELEIEQEASQMRMEVQRLLMEFRERERQEIARDLHDGPVQILAGTIFNLQAAREAAQDPLLKLELEQASLNLKGAIRELRDTMNELRPPAIIRFGLAKSARMYAEDFREKHPEIKITLRLVDDSSLLSESERLAIFRIYQESLNNIARHAQASRIWVSTTIKNNSYRLKIRDNGQGFTVPKDLIGQTQRGHYGLVGMKERADAIGAELTVTSDPGMGTIIMVALPDKAAGKH